MNQTADGKYTFQVIPNANKFEIKNAVEKNFKVKVEKIATISARGKKRRVGKYQGKTSDWKKAVVTLKEGQKIEGIFEQ